jgi:type I restriction-modification system DNA methylase subunit
MENISKLEADLWCAADNLRANSKLTSSEYCMPVLGVIFLRHATNRYDAVIRQIEADILDALNETIEPITEQFRTLSFANQKLRAARDLLLPRLMSGEIAV